MTNIAIIVGAAAVALGLLVWVSQRWGQTRERKKAAEDRLDAARDAREIQNEVEALPDQQRRDELGRWVRKSG